MIELIVNNLYLIHALVIWVGSLREVIHIYRRRSAEDITVFWIACLLASEVLALPRALTSGYYVWWLCHLVSTVLITVLLVGVIKYRKAPKGRRSRYQQAWRKANPKKVRRAGLAHRQRMKTEVLLHYGEGVLACVLCGESRLACLSIDHIAGEGTAHRRRIACNPGQAFYYWLKHQGYPKGYRTLCMNCQFLERDRLIKLKKEDE